MKKSVTALFATVGLALMAPSAHAELEDWYFNWNIGMARNHYASPLEETMNAIADLPGVERTQLAMDMFGFYIPVDDQSIIGFVINSSGDQLADSVYSMQLNTYIYGASYMNFFQAEIGEGVFVRADAGMARGVIIDSENNSSTSDWGFGVLGGVGYGIPISSETRILLGMDYALKKIEGDNYTTLSFTIGGLW